MGECSSRPGNPRGAASMDQGDGHIPHGSQNPRSGPRTKARTVLSTGDSADVVRTILNQPMPPHDGQKTFRVGDGSTVFPGHDAHHVSHLMDLPTGGCATRVSSAANSTRSDPFSGKGARMAAACRGASAEGASRCATPGLPVSVFVTRHLPFSILRDKSISTETDQQYKHLKNGQRVARYKKGEMFSTDARHTLSRDAYRALRKDLSACLSNHRFVPQELRHLTPSQPPGSTPGPGPFFYYPIPRQRLVWLICRAAGTLLFPLV